MSATSIQEFLTKVAEDPALQEELAKAMESENDREAVTELAQSKGYDFTSQELGQAIEQIEAAIASGSELSEDELESVAGGMIGITPALMLPGVPGLPFPGRPGIPGRIPGKW